MNENKKQALEYYKKFSNVEGNEYIAEPFAIETIIELLRIYKPKSILELGSGIGAITYSVTEFLNSQNLDYKLYASESNEYCLTQLPKNLGDNFKDIQLYNSFKDIPSNLKYDFILIDGSDSALELIKKNVSKNAVIFVEGFRMAQVEIVKKLFPNSLHTTIISDYKNPDFGPRDSNRWSGGGQLIFPDPSFNQRLLYLKYRFSTFLKYKILRNFRK